jgi:hypothetical protein
LGARHSLRPLIIRGREIQAKPRAKTRGEIAKPCLCAAGCLKIESVMLQAVIDGGSVIASEAKQSMGSNEWIASSLRSSQ